MKTLIENLAFIAVGFLVLLFLAGVVAGFILIPTNISIIILIIAVVIFLSWLIGIAVL